MLCMKRCAHAVQVDYHSFEGILYCTPAIGWALQHLLRRSISAALIGSARLGARVWPPLEGWLCRTLPGGEAQVYGLKAWAARLWWRQEPPVAWRKVPAPYDPRL